MKRVFRQKYLFLLLISLSFTFNSCIPDVPFSDIPEIEFKSLDYVNSGEVAVLTIKFKDGDGDIGSDDPDVKDAIITFYELVDGEEVNAFPNAPTDRNIPSLTPNSKNQTVEGEILFKFDALNHPAGEYDFLIECTIVDRAGHRSNTIRSNWVTPVDPPTGG